MERVLRGMTWNHPRGYDPLVACAQAWRAARGPESPPATTETVSEPETPAEQE